MWRSHLASHCAFPSSLTATGECIAFVSPLSSRCEFISFDHNDAWTTRSSLSHGGGSYTTFFVVHINAELQMLLSFPAIISPVLLLIAVRTCTLHPNCKYLSKLFIKFDNRRFHRALIILWMLAQVIMNVSIIFYSFVFIFVEHEGAPEFIHLPGFLKINFKAKINFSPSENVRWKLAQILLCIVLLRVWNKLRARF